MSKPEQISPRNQIAARGNSLLILGIEYWAAAMALAEAGVADSDVPSLPDEQLNDLDLVTRDLRRRSRASAPNPELVTAEQLLRGTLRLTDQMATLARAHAETPHGGMPSALLQRAQRLVESMETLSEDLRALAHEAVLHEIAHRTGCTLAEAREREARRWR